MRIIKHTSRMLTIRDENLLFSGMIWMLFTLLAFVAAGILFSMNPAGSRPMQALGLIVGGLILAAGVLIGAWQAKVQVVTLNLPEESVTIAEGTWLKVHSVDVRPLSDVVQPRLSSEEETISRSENHVPHFMRESRGGESHSDEDHRGGTTVTYRTYGLRLVMLSGGDIPLSLRHRSWEEAQHCLNAIASFLSPFRHLHVDETASDEDEYEQVAKKRSR